MTRTSCVIWYTKPDLQGSLPKQTFVLSIYKLLFRCRARFPVPVILYKGKHICRSSTLSGGPEIYGRSGLDYLFYGSDNGDKSKEDNDTETVVSQSDWQLFDRVRSQDIKLLKTFNVGTIVDFMVENKKVKFGVK